MSRSIRVDAEVYGVISAERDRLQGLVDWTSMVTGARRRRVTLGEAVRRLVMGDPARTSVHRGPGA